MIFFQILPFFRFAEPWNPFWGRCTCIDDWSTKILCFHILVPLMDSIRKPSLFDIFLVCAIVQSRSRNSKCFFFLYCKLLGFYYFFQVCLLFKPIWSLPGLLPCKIQALPDTEFYDSPKLFNLKFTIASIVLIAYK